MKYFIIVLLLLFSALLVYFMYWAFRFRNLYKTIFIFGKKGAGKSTYLCKIAQKHLKKGWNVVSTTEIPGCYLIDYKDIGKIDLPENTLLLVDEVSLVWGNRDWKNFDKDLQYFIRCHRHLRIKVVMASQSFDVDRIIRDCCDKMYMLVNVCGCLTIGKEIKRKLTVVKPSENAESRIADELVISSPLLFFLGAREFIWVPRWRKYFDSFERKSFPKKQLKLCEYPDGIKRIKNKKLILQKERKN